jgi:hypothetical protein
MKERGYIWQLSKVGEKYRCNICGNQVTIKVEGWWCWSAAGKTCKKLKG